MKPGARPEVVIVGAGSVGMFLATRLCRAADVRLAIRSGRVTPGPDEIEVTGLESARFEVPTVDLSRLGRLSRQTLIVVACKAFQLRDCLGALKPNLDQGGAEARVILTQNGLGIVDEARKVLPEACFGKLICWFGVRKTGSSTVEWAGRGAIDWVTPDAALREQFGALLRAAGVPANVSESIPTAEWRKALMNVSLNALCAVAGVRNREAIENPELRKSLELLLDEAIAVARLQGVEFGARDREMVLEAIRSVGENYNSTYQDLVSRRPTEVPWLNGAVVRMGKDAGIPTPANQLITSLISALEVPNGCSKKVGNA